MSVQSLLSGSMLNAELRQVWIMLDCQAKVVGGNITAGALTEVLSLDCDLKLGWGRMPVQLGLQ